jgi:hypothetical protein
MLILYYIRYYAIYYKDPITNIEYSLDGDQFISGGYNKYKFKFLRLKDTQIFFKEYEHVHNKYINFIMF